MNPTFFLDEKNAVSDPKINIRKEKIQWLQHYFFHNFIYKSADDSS